MSGLAARHEEEITYKYGTARAYVVAEPCEKVSRKQILELRARYKITVSASSRNPREPREKAQLSAMFIS